MQSMRDLTGQRFGRLVVIEKDITDRDGLPCWKCRCDCGTTFTVQGVLLKKHITTCCRTCKLTEEENHVNS